MSREDHYEELIGAARGGDPDAFAELAKCYHALVFGTCWRLARNQADAEDLEQLVWVAVWKNRDKLRASTFKAFLVRSATNKCIDHFRRQLTRKLLDGPPPEDLSSIEDTKPTIEEFLIQSVGETETAVCVQRVLQAMEPVHRVVLLAKVLEEMKLEKIAAYLVELRLYNQCSVATASRLCGCAKEEFRQLYEEQCRPKEKR